VKRASAKAHLQKKITTALINPQADPQEGLAQQQEGSAVRAHAAGPRAVRGHRAFDQQMERGFTRFLQRYRPGNCSSSSACGRPAQASFWTSSAGMPELEINLAAQVFWHHPAVDGVSFNLPPARCWRCSGLAAAARAPCSADCAGLEAPDGGRRALDGHMLAPHPSVLDLPFAVQSTLRHIFVGTS